MEQVFRAVISALIVVTCLWINVDAPFEPLENTVIVNQVNGSSDNSSSSTDTELEDPCSVIYDNETPWICVYPDGWESNFSSGTSSISVIIEAGNMPSNDGEIYIKVYLTGDTDWCLPVEDSSNTPIIDGICNSLSMGNAGGGDSNFSKENLFMLENTSAPTPDGCYFLSVEVSVNGWENTLTNLSRLTPESSSFNIGGANCSSTDFSQTNGWNETTIAEQENVEDKESAIPGFTLIGTLSVAYIAAIFGRQRFL